jgi:hypothetical protein
LRPPNGRDPKLQQLAPRDMELDEHEAPRR